MQSKSNGKGKVRHTSGTSVVDRSAQYVDVNSLKEAMENNTKDITISLSTLGALQKSPSPFYDPLKCIHNYFNWILIDEAGQTVDTDAYTLHHFLNRNGGRYVFFGDPKQLSCYSTLRLSRRSAMDAALHCGTEWMCLRKCFRLKGTLGQFFCQSIYEAEGMQLHEDVNICSFMFIEILDDAENNEAGGLRRSHTSAGLEREIMMYLRSRRKKDDEDLHYMTFYSDQNKLFKAKLRQTKPGFGIHTVDACQGLDSKSHALLSTGRRHGIGFLSDIRRLIVSLSRSQKSTILVAHSSIVDTGHPVGCVFQALKKIACQSEAYVLFNNKNRQRSIAKVKEKLETRIGNFMNENSAEVVSRSLAAPCARTQVTVGTALANYMHTSLNRFQEAGVEDKDEIEGPDGPEQDSDSDAATTGEPGNAAPSAPAPPPAEQSIQYPLHEWAVVRMKNLNLIPAKFGFDREQWPGEEPGPHQVFTFMAQAFEWEPTQLEWFLKSKDILWAFSQGGKAEGDGRYYHNHITRNTKVIGMLPLRLFLSCFCQPGNSSSIRGRSSWQSTFYQGRSTHNFIYGQCT